VTAHVLEGHVGHLLHVGPGREHPLAPVDDHGRHVVATVGLSCRLGDLGLHLGVESVHLRSVEPDGSDALADLEPCELSHCASRRRVDAASAPSIGQRKRHVDAASTHYF
jgi:hypothetical protein